jgi:hypothetical protein
VEDLLNALQRSVRIDHIASLHPDVIAQIEELDYLKTAATFGGLLARPDLQANCLRLETLVHLAMAYCKGRRAPTKPVVQRCFERIGTGPCGVMEDPSEDVFVTLVTTGEGDFRVFEGIRESTGFYLMAPNSAGKSRVAS